MPGYRSAYEDIVLLREDLDDLEAFHLHPVAAHAARHTHAFHDAAGIGRVTQRTGGTLTVMLTVGLFAYTMEAMTLNDTLETFTF